MRRVRAQRDSVPVGFRVRATNTEGNSFYRDYDLEIERGWDGDADGYPDGCDNCPQDINPDQRDFDGDAKGDACDTDDDNDGVLDVDDSCPLEDPGGLDADVDGCIDTFDGMTGLVGDLVETGILPGRLENSLTSKIENAARSAERGHICAAVNELQALQHEIEAQRDKKIPADTANLLLMYAQNLIQQLLDTHPGLACRSSPEPSGPLPPTASRGRGRVSSAQPSAVELGATVAPAWSMRH